MSEKEAQEIEISRLPLKATDDILCNEEWLSHPTEYRGRAVLIGRSPDGKSIIEGELIEGRSKDSSAREMKEHIFTSEDLIATYRYSLQKMYELSGIDLNEEGSLGMRHCVPPEGNIKAVRVLSLNPNADPEKEKWIIYPSFLQHPQDPHISVVANGVQGIPILAGMLRDNMEGHFDKIPSEGDHPNYTPRISIMTDTHTKFSTLLLSKSLVANNPNSGFAKYIYEFNIGHNRARGIGYVMTTYEKNGSPLPPFASLPKMIRVGDNLTAMRNLLSRVLDKDIFVSGVLIQRNIETGEVIDLETINRYTSFEEVERKFESKK